MWPNMSLRSFLIWLMFHSADIHTEFAVCCFSVCRMTLTLTSLWRSVGSRSSWRRCERTWSFTTSCWKRPWWNSSTRTMPTLLICLPTWSVKVNVALSRYSYTFNKSTTTACCPRETGRNLDISAQVCGEIFQSVKGMLGSYCKLPLL